MSCLIRAACFFGNVSLRALFVIVGFIRLLFGIFSLLMLIGW
jgi:hypothetical protein